ncbi:tyrosine-type recombinase/integrase [Kitasatospora sp. NPDC087271]|uniref:tyrosine-type recombinase/integrase n=1 Tax=Kitasatospora sp. NPDC087271 TaxID=3364067 RepID=UPI0038028052
MRPRHLACSIATRGHPHTASADTRHTHATRMWEGGMRELTLQKRLGHASPESTRLYTRVSDPAVVADYHRALDTPGKPREATS